MVGIHPLYRILWEVEAGRPHVRGQGLVSLQKNGIYPLTLPFYLLAQIQPEWSSLTGPRSLKVGATNQACVHSLEIGREIHRSR